MTDGKVFDEAHTLFRAWLSHVKGPRQTRRADAVPIPLRRERNMPAAGSARADRVDKGTLYQSPLRGGTVFVPE